MGNYAATDGWEGADFSSRKGSSMIAKNQSPKHGGGVARLQGF